MKVLFRLMIEAKEASTWMRMEGELPFAPRPGMVIRFCKRQCCDGLEVGKWWAACVWEYQEQRWEVILAVEWKHVPAEEVIRHFEECGFKEEEGSRESREGE